MSALQDCTPERINSWPTVSSTAGQKRSLPSLLPAFELHSSSPGFLRPSKRQACTAPSNKYPTPLPSSTIGIFSSPSPTFNDCSDKCLHVRSALPERAPLSDVPTVIVPEDGRVIKMGRSSKSSDFQLSSSRLISRVHVEARYIAATAPLEPNSIEIKCTGWNGLKLHCSSQTWELAKNDTFTSESESSEILVDAQDARVLIAWPRSDQITFFGSPNNVHNCDSTLIREHNSYTDGIWILSSPTYSSVKIRSPLSPCPRRPNLPIQPMSNTEPTALQVVQVFEDLPSASFNSVASETSKSIVSIHSPPGSPLSSSESELSEKCSEVSDEENNSILQSIEPIDANQFVGTESISTIDSPTKKDVPLTDVRRPASYTSENNSSTIINHMINQLAYSLKSSLPLSELFIQLPASWKENRLVHSNRPETKVLVKSDLCQLLNSTSCVGEISREGKDAAGKPLESEYYYILENDEDEFRRTAVSTLRKPSLRNCRKSHKQYYWRKPKTP